MTPTTDKLSDRYLRRLARLPALKREEERFIAEKSHEGDAEARNELIRRNLRLVVRIAMRYRHMGVSLQDLVAEGNMGLIRAAELYDPHQGARFSTYAGMWIQQKIIRYLEKNSRDVKIPESKRKLLKTLRKTEERLKETLGRPPRRAEIFAASGLTKAQQKEARLAEIEVDSLESPIEDGSHASTVGSRIADSRQSSPEMPLLKMEKWFEAVAALDVLTEEELEIISRRFGLQGGNTESLKSIGKDFGLSRERIRQMEELALTKARRRLKGTGPIDDQGPQSAQSIARQKKRVDSKLKKISNKKKAPMKKRLKKSG